MTSLGSVAPINTGVGWGASRNRFGLWSLVVVAMTAGGVVFRHSTAAIRPERMLALVAITVLASVIVPTAVQATTNGSVVMCVLLSVALPLGFWLPLIPGDGWFEPFTLIAIGATAGLLFGALGHAVGAEIVRRVGRAPTPTIRSQFGPLAVFLAVVFLQASVHVLYAILPISPPPSW